MSSHKVRNALFAGGAVTAAAVAGSAATNPRGRWYQELNKPAWQPPNVAIPIVWTSLYAGIAVTSAAVLNNLDSQGEEEEATDYRRALVKNLALNAGWSWLFFRKENLPVATAGAAVLAVSSIRLARRAGRANRRYGKMLAPYAAWTSFATFLTATLWSKNRQR